MKSVSVKLSKFENSARILESSIIIAHFCGKWKKILNDINFRRNAVLYCNRTCVGFNEFSCFRCQQKDHSCAKGLLLFGKLLHKTKHRGKSRKWNDILVGFCYMNGFDGLCVH